MSFVPRFLVKQSKFLHEYTKHWFVLTRDHLYGFKKRGEGRNEKRPLGQAFHGSVSIWASLITWWKVLLTSLIPQARSSFAAVLTKISLHIYMYRCPEMSLARWLQPMPWAYPFEWANHDPLQWWGKRMLQSSDIKLFSACQFNYFWRGVLTNDCVCS